MLTAAIIAIDPELCTGCKRCVETCPARAIEGDQGKPQQLDEKKCVACGRCVQICSAYDSIFDQYTTPREARLAERRLSPSLKEPLFAAYDRNQVDEVKAALAEPGRLAIAYCQAPVCTALAEDFDLPTGGFSPGQVVAALRKLGFSRIYGTSLASALAVVEHAHELVQRLEGGIILPVINSSCPAAVKSYPELIHYLASCKSPQQIAGALFKSCAAQAAGIRSEDAFNVSIVPCTSRKLEADRPEMAASGNPAIRDVDAVLTTRELAYLIKENEIDVSKLAEEEFDDDLPEVAGAENAYSTTGEVTQAVLRAAAELLSLRTPATSSADVMVTEAQEEGAHIACMQINGYDLKAVAVSGLQNAIPYLDDIKAGKRDLAFLEVMSCPMGCVSGGGQPKVLLPEEKAAVYSKRLDIVRRNAAPRSTVTEHPSVKAIYRDLLLTPCGDKSNRILHTQYFEREMRSGPTQD
jgi:iron only hydrogenase large subunit-like protein